MVLMLKSGLSKKVKQKLKSQEKTSVSMLALTLHQVLSLKFGNVTTVYQLKIIGTPMTTALL